MTYKSDGINLDTIFEPLGSATKRADVGYKLDGVDISNLYYPLTVGGVSPESVGYKVNGQDLSNYFAAFGTVLMDSLLINGDEGLVDATGKHTISHNGTVVQTTNARCGSHALDFYPGSSCSIPRVGSELELGNEDFTMDFWINAMSYGSMTFFMTYSNQGYMLTLDATLGDQDVPPVDLKFDVLQGGSFIYRGRVNINNYLMPNFWNHVGICRTGSNMYAAINGMVIPLADIGSTVIPPSNTNATMGSFNTYFRLDHFRIKKGEALFTSNYGFTDEALGYQSGTLN